MLKPIQVWWLNDEPKWWAEKGRHLENLEQIRHVSRSLELFIESIWLAEFNRQSLQRISELFKKNFRTNNEKITIGFLFSYFVLGEYKSYVSLPLFVIKVIKLDNN